MGFLGDVWKATTGIITGDWNSTPSGLKAMRMYTKLLQLSLTL